MSNSTAYTAKIINIYLNFTPFIMIQKCVLFLGTVYWGLLGRQIFNGRNAEISRLFVQYTTSRGWLACSHCRSFLGWVALKIAKSHCIFFLTLIYAEASNTQVSRSKVDFFSASKWPIEHQEELVFGYKNIKTIKNMFIPKGAVYAKVRKKVQDEEKLYHLVGLHLFVS